ncbi:G-protein gamma subunit [Chiua virens]|nr:G-protein gamma subunit [Chiua virens]
MNARPHKQSMSELKLRRLTEHNQRLREDLARPRMRVSEASASLIRYCKTTKDHLVRHVTGSPFDTWPHYLGLQVPSVWGPVGKGEDPYAPPQTGCNCIVM